ncbi:hypothetical protein N7G274_007731 [Stereocaulon virgatum]|uniref:Uncharacterized protein n=1 Tax=Stereocaulon virgatum TaxID=373712 RepID=A0ABR4A1V2_9LECA
MLPNALIGTHCQALVRFHRLSNRYYHVFPAEGVCRASRGFKRSTAHPNKSYSQVSYRAFNENLTFRALAMHETSFFSSEIDLPDSLAINHPRIYSDTRHTASYHKSEPLLPLPSLSANAESSTGTSQTTYELSIAGEVGSFSALIFSLTSYQSQPWLCKGVERLQHPPRLPPSSL